MLLQFSRSTGNTKLRMTAVLVALIILLVVSGGGWIYARMRLCFDIPFPIGTDDRSLSILYGVSSGRGTVLCITSGGCNPLDECLSGRDVVISCDAAVTQNYLLELKIAAVRTLSYSTFWDMFGYGASATFHADYVTHLRPLLSPGARTFWDPRGFYFEQGRGGLYRSASAPVRFGTEICHRHWPQGYNAFLMQECVSAEQQVQTATGEQLLSLVETYGRFHRLAQSLIPQTMGIVDVQWQGVDPAAVLQQGLERRARVPESFCKDYITRLYVTGRFSPECCPAYLKQENYALLQQRVNRISIAEGDMLTAMRSLLHRGERIDAFFPLDHLDYLAPDEVEQEVLCMSRLSGHLGHGVPVAVVKSVSRVPSFISKLSDLFDLRDITMDLELDGSDIYMVQSAWLLLARRRLA